MATEITQDCTRAEGETDRRQELLSRNDIEREYRGLTRRWLELAALDGKGPPMLKLSARMVRYQRGAFEDWLRTRAVTSTSQRIQGSRGDQG